MSAPMIIGHRGTSFDAPNTLAAFRLDFGAWRGTQWQGERIPTLAELLAILPAGKKFFIEFKCGDRTAAQTLATSAIDTEQLHFLAFDVPLLAALRGEFPSIKSCLNLEYHRAGLSAHGAH